MEFWILCVVLLVIWSQRDRVHRRFDADNDEPEPELHKYACMVNGYCEYYWAYSQQEAYVYFRSYDSSVRMIDVFQA
jgi:hypothetical protein